MTLILILSGVILGVGALLYAHHRLTYTEPNETRVSEEDGKPDTGQECCGMHLTCDKDSLIAGIDPDTLYYDDEELDRYAGRDSDDYTDVEMDEFREIMLTLRPEEIAPWARSVTARGISLPSEIRQELLMIVAEARQTKESTDKF